MHVNKIIKKIKSGECSESELLKYLSMKGILVQSNAMREIGRKGYNSKAIIERLENLCEFRDIKEHRFYGPYTIGDLAIATLIKIGINKDRLRSYIELDELNKSFIENILEGMFVDFN